MTVKNMLLGLLIVVVVSGYSFLAVLGISALTHSSKAQASSPAVSSGHPYTFKINRSSGDCITAYVKGSQYYEAVVPHAFKSGCSSITVTVEK